MTKAVVGSVSVTRCDEERPLKSSAKLNRSVLVNVSSMVRFVTAAPRNALMVKGSRPVWFSLASTARKKASWRWMRLKSESPSYSQ